MNLNEGMVPMCTCTKCRKRFHGKGGLMHSINKENFKHEIYEVDFGIIDYLTRH